MNYLQDRNSLSEKKWTSQNSRFRKKLLPDHFRMDEKTLSDFAAFAAEYGKNISFFNTANRPDGDWASFFRDDPTISLLLLQSLPTDRWSQQTSEAIESFEKTKTENGKLLALKNLVTLATAIFADLEKAASTIHPYKDFHRQLLKYISNRLSPFFAIVNETNKILRESYDWRNPTAVNFDIAFGSYWYSDKVFEFSETAQWIASAVQSVGTGLPKVIRDIDVLKKETRLFLDEEVLKGGNVQPHIALFIAFCQLYEHAQKKINHISERHLKYYYNDILNLRPLEGQKDSAYLTFNITKGAGSVQLSPGTLFNYTPKEQPLEYFVLGQPASLHEGSIAKIAALNISAQPWLGAFMNRKASDVPVYDLLYPGNNTVEFGFEISSQYLVLEEGDRRITFDFSLDRLETIRLKEKINAGFFPFDSEKLNALIAGSWNVAYSHASGMQPIDQKNLEVYFHNDAMGEHLVLRFDVLVKKHELSCVSLNPDEPEGDATLKFNLSSKGAALYSLFRDLSFSQAVLSTAVIGIKNLIIQNDFGPLENGHPFEPFGPKPIIGSSLYIGHKNLFLKPLKELTINLEWNNLPLDEHGFADYYKAYDGIDNNSVFKASVSFLKDKNWQPAENRQVLNLFTGLPTDSTPDNNLLSTIRRLNEIDLYTLGLNSVARSEGPLTEYNLSSTDGFIRLELCYPEAAFGHDQYAELIQKMAFKAVKEKKEQDMVNEPYTPSLKTISVEYKSEYEIKHWGDKVKLKKIQPFGSEEEQSNHHWSLVPYFPNGGSFFVGLEPVLAGKEISLLFKISNGGLNQNDAAGTIQFSVLNKTGWVVLPPENITLDETRQLQRTGIIKLKLPVLETAGNSMDGENFWLRFDLPDANIGYYIEDIHLNAALVTRENFLQSDSEILLPNSITSLKNALIQVDKIEQPYASFGGRKPETEFDFHTRASERIRHKSRAVSNQDIEQLLMSRFPEIQSLKCLNHVNSDLQFEPGTLSVVVIPTESEDTATLERYFPKEKLELMQHYLQRQALGGMKISVLNPVYEKIRLKFNVRFKRSFDEKLALKKIHQKIMDFLDPWKSHKIISQGGLIPVTTVLNEIELQEYVDFVTNFSVFQLVNGQIINLDAAHNNNLVVKPKSPASVLIPDKYHKIISFNDKTATDTPGINDMMIGNDFLVHAIRSNASSGLGFDTIEKTFRLSPESAKISPEKHTFTLYLKE